MNINLKELAHEIINGKRLLRTDDLSFFNDCNLDELCNEADNIRKELCGNYVDLCAIINARSGKCSENCSFCAQSSFNHTGCEIYDFMDEDKIIKAAEENQAEGVKRFSIVTAGKALTGEEFEKALSAFNKMNKKLSIGLCASMGFISFNQLIELKKAGVTSYHHNIETSKRNFSNICTTHSYEMKIETLKKVKEAGLRVCSGGIIGMGETFEDRIDMAVSLSEIPVDSIPLNALTPIKGTPLENNKRLTEDEILRTVAMFRFINPKADIRLAAGRKLLSSSGEKAFKSGVNATITGNMLTTTGTTIKGDKELLLKLGRIV